MTSRLPTMNRDEKMNHIENCKSLIDKQKTFYGRLCLAASEDKDAADMKRLDQKLLPMPLCCENLLSAWTLWSDTLKNKQQREKVDPFTSYFK